MLFCSLSKESGVRFVHRRRKTAGFTLIELLVVVLIIGILSAVALPQYELAVAKSRAAQIMPFLSSVRTAQEAYYLANGEYSAKWGNLDISLPAGLTATDCVSGGADTECVAFSFGTKCSLLSSGGSAYCSGGPSGLPELGVSYNYGVNKTTFGNFLCIAKPQTLGEKVCLSLGGVLKQSNANGNYYSVL